MIMAKAPVNGILLLSERAVVTASGCAWFSRRSYGALAEKTAGATVGADAIRKGAGEEQEEKEKKVFWMRDPKSGNWVPESHFDDVDVAEMREKFLAKKKGKL